MHGPLAASSPLEALGVGVTAGRGVEDGTAADGRLAAKDDTVAARCDNGRRQPKLGEPLPCARHPSRYRRRAVVHMKARPVRDGHELLERHVEPVARCEHARCKQRVAPPQLVALHAGQRERDALPRLGPVDRTVVYLDAPHADVASTRLGAENVAGADRSRPEGPGRDRADPAQREHPVDVEARRRVDTGVKIVFL